MFSQRGDTVLDPFLGTGTTMQAAILTGRNSCGYDIDANFETIIREGVEELDLDLCNALIKKRFDSHKEFVDNREKSGKDVKHFNNTLNYKVMTKQESKIKLNYLTSIQINKDDEYVVEYEDHLDLITIPFIENIFTIAR